MKFSPRNALAIFAATALLSVSGIGLGTTAFADDTSSTNTVQVEAKAAADKAAADAEAKAAADKAAADAEAKAAADAKEAETQAEADKQKAAEAETEEAKEAEALAPPKDESKVSENTKPESVPTFKLAEAEINTEPATCDAHGFAEWSTLINASGGELVQTPGNHSSVATADEGAKFSDGEVTKTVKYNIEDKLPPQSTDANAPCYVPPPPVEKVATAPTSQDKCEPKEGTDDSVTIPADEHFTYKLDGVDKAAGTYSVTGTSVMVTAHAKDGFTPKPDSKTSWTFEFTKVACVVPPIKVFVCKYVGKPGVDERLQTGNNPISVSVNAIPDYQGPGSWFADAQGRSFVLEVDNGQPEPSISKCPAPEGPPDVVYVVPDNPTKVDLCEPVYGPSPDGINIPEADMGYYTIDGKKVSAGFNAVAGTSAKVVFVPIKDVEIKEGATSKWTFEFTKEKCPVVLTKVTAVDGKFADLCGLDYNLTFTPVSTEGVEYVQVREGNTLTVTAKVTDPAKYELTNPNWSQTKTDELVKCPVVLKDLGHKKFESRTCTKVVKKLTISNPNDSQVNVFVGLPNTPAFAEFLLEAGKSKTVDVPKSATIVQILAYPGATLDDEFYFEEVPFSVTSVKDCSPDDNGAPGEDNGDQPFAPAVAPVVMPDQPTSNWLAAALATAMALALTLAGVWQLGLVKAAKK